MDEETKELKLRALPKWLISKNDFKEAAKLINDIRADTNNLKPSSDDKKVFNDLNRFIADISNNKVKKESTIKRMKKNMFNLEQLRQKESTAFQSMMINVLYCLFNSFNLDKKSLLLKK